MHAYECVFLHKIKRPTPTNDNGRGARASERIIIQEILYLHGAERGVLVPVTCSILLEQARMSVHVYKKNKCQCSRVGCGV